MPSGSAGGEEPSPPPERKHSVGASAPGMPGRRPPKREVDAGELLPLFQ